MAKKRNLASIGGLGRRPSRTLDRDPGAGRAVAGLGASDISLGEQFTVDSNQRLALKKARTVPLTTQGEYAGSSNERTEQILNQLIINLRASGILEA